MSHQIETQMLNNPNVYTWLCSCGTGVSGLSGMEARDKSIEGHLKRNDTPEPTTSPKYDDAPPRDPTSTTGGQVNQKDDFSIVTPIGFGGVWA